MENLLHIVFDAAGAEALRQSFQLDDIIKGEIIVMEDNLAFGPLNGETEQAREEWWNTLHETTEGFPGKGDEEKLQSVLEQMQEDDGNEVWIWAAQNARDVCGYYSLVPPMAAFPGRVHIIYLNNLPFLNDKGGIFYPSALGQILPKEFLKARKLAREITPSEFEMDGDEWERLSRENQPVRVLEGGKKITGRPADHFDKELLSYCTGNFQKAARVLSQAISKSGHIQDEAFLNGRLKELAAEGRLETKGTLKNPRDFEVKLKSEQEQPQT